MNGASSVKFQNKKASRIKTTNDIFNRSLCGQKAFVLSEIVSRKAGCCTKISWASHVATWKGTLPSNPRCGNARDFIGSGLAITNAASKIYLMGSTLSGRATKRHPNSILFMGLVFATRA